MEPQEKKPISHFSFLDAVSEIFLEALSFSISRKWLKRVSNTAFETRPPVETPINASFKHKLIDPLTMNYNFFGYIH